MRQSNRKIMKLLVFFDGNKSRKKQFLPWTFLRGKKYVNYCSNLHRTTMDRDININRITYGFCNNFFLKKRRFLSLSIIMENLDRILCAWIHWFDFCSLNTRKNAFFNKLQNLNCIQLTAKMFRRVSEQNNSWNNLGVEVKSASNISKW